MLEPFPDASAPVSGADCQPNGSPANHLRFMHKYLLCWRAVEESLPPKNIRIEFIWPVVQNSGGGGFYLEAGRPLFRLSIEKMVPSEISSECPFPSPSFLFFKMPYFCTILHKMVDDYFFLKKNALTSKSGWLWSCMTRVK